MNYVEHFCDLRMDADLCLGNNVLMAKLRVLDSLALQSGLHCVQELYADQYFGNITCSFKLRLMKFRSS